ncbi:MAG: hypothetical protein U5R30_05440 [Deltaproteobacteria bacterium]|jgi:hypothetical protein|nr:hypothetical protein [Deltaproteobacteria bacterium]
MKKLLIVGMLVVFLAGCGHMAQESEFFDHSTLYRDWDHAKFSMWGYKEPTALDAQGSTAQEWWGIPIPYVPAK